MTTPAKKRTPSEYLGLTARGMAMGAADVIPGVSGGTMAFILGIYEELVDSIRALGRPPFLRAAARGRFAEAARAINLPFLLAVVSGVLISVFSLMSLMTQLLQEHPIFIWSFFFGLIVGSVILVGGHIPRWKPSLIIGLLSATVGAYLLVGLVPAQTPETWWYIIFSGIVSICAMILPGISGAFILLLMGKYEFIAESVEALRLDIIGLFALGAVTGLVTIAQLLSWLFKKYHNITVALLTGLMLGSLRKVWPWKETETWFVDRHGVRQPLLESNVLPEWMIGGDLNMEIIWAVLLALVGFAVVYILEKLADVNVGEAEE